MLGLMVVCDMEKHTVVRMKLSPDGSRKILSKTIKEVEVKKDES
jgi:hypothetical protein|tara:strand:- start:3026 stop:3157 length:132 start_codon:yes stop_codon:yes gene_type:complete